MSLQECKICKRTMKKTSIKSHIYNTKIHKLNSIKLIQSFIRKNKCINWHNHYINDLNKPPGLICDLNEPSVLICELPNELIYMILKNLNDFGNLYIVNKLFKNFIDLYFLKDIPTYIKHQNIKYWMDMQFGKYSIEYITCDYKEYYPSYNSYGKKI